MDVSSSKNHMSYLHTSHTYVFINTITFEYKQKNPFEPAQHTITIIQETDSTFNFERSQMDKVIKIHLTSILVARGHASDPIEGKRPIIFFIRSLELYWVD